MFQNDDITQRVSSYVKDDNINLKKKGTKSI